MLYKWQRLAEGKGYKEYELLNECVQSPAAQFYNFTLVAHNKMGFAES
jgi:hypothetical protein